MPLPTAYGTIPLGGALPEAYVPGEAIPLLGGALESGYGEVSYAVNMTAAASGSNGITVADDDDIDFGTGDFAIVGAFAYQQGVAATKAEENLLVQSQAFDNASWGNSASAIVRTANTGVAPDGTTTADSWKGNGTVALHYSGQSITLVSAPASRFSIYAKADGVNFIQLFTIGGSGYANFDITSGAGVVGTAAAPFSDLTIQDAGSGWYRCTCLITNSAHNNIYIALSNSSTALRASMSFATSNGVFLWGAQLEHRSSVTAYTPTTAAAITRSVYWLALKYQDGSNYWGYRINSTGLLEFIAAVNGLVKIYVSSTAALTSSDGQIIETAFTCSRESPSDAGSGSFYVGGNQLGASVSIAAATPASLSNSGSLYLMGSDAVRNLSNFVRAILMNFAPTASEVLDLCTNGIPASWKWGSQTPTYSSNFSAGVDSWVASQGAVAGNIDGIGGQDDWLRYTTNSTSSTAHYTGRGVLIAGKKNRVSVTYYIPAGQTAINGIGFYDGNVAVLGTKGAVTNTVTTVTFDCTPSDNNLRVYALSNDSRLVNDPGGDDVFYIKGVTVTVLGATMALLPDTIPTSSATTWSDTSGNTGGGTLPAASATKVTIRR